MLDETDVFHLLVLSMGVLKWNEKLLKCHILENIIMIKLISLHVIL